MRTITVSSKKLTVAVSLFSVLLFPAAAHAEELIISGNGAESANVISQSQTTDTTVSQSNDMSVNNDVSVETNTGDNSASNNTGGDSSVNTGGAATNVGVSNAGNVSSVNTGCCPSEGSSVHISNNGAGSTNTASLTGSSSNSVNVSNVADITNTINGSANTGMNTANNNTDGDVTIGTGNIIVNEKIKNGPINVYEVNLGISPALAAALTITGNGANSINTLNVTEDNTTLVDVLNLASIINESNWDLNTGGNDASNNIDGDVAIKTGDIIFASEIVNGPINVGSVTITCCEEKVNEEEQKPPVSVPATTTTTKVETVSKSEGVGGPGKSEAVLAAAVGSVLPITGNMLWLLLLLLNLSLFSLGVVVRLHSGRGPNYVQA